MTIGTHVKLYKGKVRKNTRVLIEYLFSRSRKITLIYKRLKKRAVGMPEPMLVMKPELIAAKNKPLIRNVKLATTISGCIR